MADVSGKFFSAVKVRTGVSPSSPGTLEGETLEPVNPPGGGLNSVGITMPSAFAVANSPLTSNGTIQITGAGTIAQYVRGDGTLETFPSLTGFVPYTGATADVNLGTHDLTAERGTFENNGSSDTLTVNHTSGSGKGINVSKGGNGEALLVTKTSGSGNAMAVVGGRTALVDLSLSSVSNATGNFLTISGGVVHQRTPSETRSDVGAQAQLNGTGFVKASGTTISYDNSTYQVTSEKGQPNGYASLDSNGKVPLVQINDALIGNVNFQGLWNAATNTPTLANPPASGTKGYYYIVSTAGTFASISFEVGDWIISDGTAWGKVDNTDAVSSVFGRTGNVTAANGDYTTAQVTESGNLYYTDGRARGALSFAAGSGAYNSTTGVITIPTNNNQITNGAGYITSAALGGYVQGSGSAGQVAYWSSGSAITGESNLFWDATNDRLGIGTNSISNGTTFGGGGQINSLKLQSTNYTALEINGSTSGGSIQFTYGTNLPNQVSGLIGYNYSNGTVNEFGISNLLNGPIIFAANNIEAMRIFSSRNVHIGSTPASDAGFKLDVNGTGRFSGALSIIGNIDVLAGGVGSSFNRQISLGSGTAYNYQVRANDDDFQLREAGSHVFLAYTYGGSLGTGTIRLYNNTISTASFTGTSFIKSGGTSSQFLKADGSVDSNTYVTGGPFLPLTGGTLTGALNGTSATFTSGVTAGGNIELTNGANRQIIIGSATNYSYSLRTDNNDFVITEAGVTDRLRYSYSNVRWTFSAPSTFTNSITVGGGSLFNANSGTLTADVLTVRGGGASGNFGFRVEANNGDDLLFVNALTYNVSMISLAGSGNRIVVANSGGTLISAVIGSGLAFDGTTLTATGGSSGSISGSGTSGTIALFTGSTSIGNSVITQSSGNVGIGDTNPTSSAGWTPKLVLNATSAALVVKGINGQENTFGTSNGLYIDSLGNSTGSNNKIIFRTSDLNSSFSASTRMTITSVGNVGIGTASPTTFSGNTTLSINNSAGGAVLELQSNGTSAFRMATSSGDSALWEPRNVPVLFATNNTERIRITSGGNVLINTTSDNGNRLRVNGTIFSDSSVTATSFFESSDATIKTLVEDAYQAKGIDSVVAKLYIKNGKQELGYYAQDLEGVLPSAVSKGSNGLLNLSYREVHTAKIAYLEQRIKQLENELLKPS